MAAPAVQNNNGQAGNQQHVNVNFGPSTGLPSINTVFKIAVVTLSAAAAIAASSQNSFYTISKLASRVKEKVMENPDAWAKGLLAASIAPEAYAVVKHLAFDNPPAGLALVGGIAGTLFAIYGKQK